jgi:hypothetical protein
MTKDGKEEEPQQPAHRPGDKGSDADEPGTTTRSIDQHPPRSDPEAVLPLGTPTDDRDTL